MEIESNNGETSPYFDGSIDTASIDGTSNSNDYVRSLPKLDPDSWFAKQYDILIYVGEGAYGRVYQVRNKLNDNIYAIKRMLLPLYKSKEEEDKIIKEVKVLSKLNHANVVRYFTSWIEDGPQPSVSEDFDPTSFLKSDVEEKESTVNEDNEDDKSLIFQCESNNNSYTPNNRWTSPLYRFLYIQMEFCDKNTLKHAIDNKLYQDEDRVRRLFIQIVEGLAYIHDNDIIHGDLMPGNIFITANDCVKIGDFGLATMNVHNLFEAGDTVATRSGGKGAPVPYCAPEVENSVPTPRYDKKNDMYTLGIIFFEMCGSFNTPEERLEVLLDVRRDPARIKNYCNTLRRTRGRPSGSKTGRSLFTHKKRGRPLKATQNLVCLDESQQTLISELLSHDLDARPTAAEILRGDRICLDRRYKHSSVKRPKLSENDSSDGNSISAPRLTYLIDIDYHNSDVQRANFLEIMKDKAHKIFLLHGGIYTASCLRSDTSDGVEASSFYHHKKSFAKYLVENPRAAHMKRYTFNEYSYESVLNELPLPFTCARFDIVGPNPSNTVMDVEALLIICEFLEKCSGRVPMSDFVIRINHGSLVPVIIKYLLNEFRAKADYMALLGNETACINRALEEYDSLLGIHDLDIEKWDQILRNEVADESLFTHAVYLNRNTWVKQPHTIELKRLVQLLKSSEVKCPIVIAPSLMKGYQNSKIMFQVVRKDAKNIKPINKVVAAGVRYDKIIELCKTDSEAKRHTKQSAVGLTIYLEQFVDICQPEEEFLSKFAVFICSTDSSYASMDKLKFAKDLWAAGISCEISYIDHRSLNEIEGYAAKMKIPYILFFEKPESTRSPIRLCSWVHDRFQKQDFCATADRAEVISHLKKVVKS